jgi:hypothetical protein
MTPRARKAAAVLAIALVLFAAFVPALGPALGTIDFVPLRLVAPAVVAVIVCRAASRSLEPPAALASLVLFRAPPSTAAA